MPSITTFITFEDQAEAAVQHYIELFGSGKVLNTMKMGGRVLTVEFELLGQRMVAMNGGPSFQFTPAFSLFVGCDSQAEIDRYWDGLVTDGGKEVQCGWLVDKFGLSWQIVPNVLPRLLGDADPAKASRAVQAMMQMKKLDIAALEKAHGG